MKESYSEICLDELTLADSPITYGVIKPGEPGDVQFVRGGDLANGQVLEHQLRSITTSVSEQYKRTILKGGELLICLVGQPGAVAVAPSSLFGANIARQVGLIRLAPIADANFVSYYLRSPDGKTALGTFTGGSVQQVINLGDLRKVPVPISSIREQHRIVAILDEAFEGIATAKANAEKNLQNSKELFKSHLHTLFANPESEWSRKSLLDLCNPNRGITYGVIKLGSEVPSGTPCLRTSNVRWLRIETEGMKRISPALSADYSRTILQGGELLVNVRGTLGGVAVASQEMAGWNVSREVAVVPSDPHQIDSRFLCYMIGSGISQDWLSEVKKGATYVGINLEDLRLLPVTVPPMPKQVEIVQHLEALQEETISLETIYQQKVAALDELKQTLLHRAFNGAL